MGIWKYSEGQPEEGLLALSGCSIDISLIRDGKCPCPAAAVESEQVHNLFVIRFPLDPHERLYGLGLGFSGMTLNHGVRHLRTDHYGGSDNGRTHAPVPFYVSDAGYGVFVDVAENISFYMGGAVRLDAKNPPPEMDRVSDDDWKCDQDAEYVECSFPGHGADVYIITGNTMTDIVSQFNRFLGGGCMPPKWGLGFWQRTHFRSDEKTVSREIEESDEHGIHVDVLGLEPGWQTNAYPCSQEWDRERFPDPGAFVKSLLAQGTRVNLWENMYISRKSSVYEEIKPFCGSHMVWGGIVPDVTADKAISILTRHHDEQRFGASGYKIDECDGYDIWLWPDHASFPSGHSATQIRNVYGVRLQRMIDDLFRKDGERTYGLVRASNAGAVSLPFCLYNDCYDFRQFLTGLATAGFCGVLWAPEVRDAKTPEEWVRRFQLSALSPLLMLNGWANGAKPWKFRQVESIVRDTINFRRQLLPYLYHAFYVYHKEGIPPFRPLVMDWSACSGRKIAGSDTLDDTENPYEMSRLADVVDQYIIGDCLMAAPMFPGRTQREVLMPPGCWFDYYTGEKMPSGRVLYTCTLERTPLFVKDGGMIPLINEDGALHIRCYGEKGSRDLYDDDGESYLYEKGIYAMLRLSFETQGSRIVGACQTEAHGYETAYRNTIFERI